MDASNPLPSNAPPAGELVVLDGASLLRYPLVAPVTLVGVGPPCDVSLPADGLASPHCLIAFVADGPILRDLSGGHTRVNGQPVSSCPLHPGDRLQLGPLTLTLDLPAPGTTETRLPSASLEAEQQAVRVQVAAVAAQHVALAELENRLDQRGVALERQRDQLASHLDERRQQLLELREQVRGERSQCQTDCQAAREQAVTQQQEAAEALAEAGQVRQRVVQERQRLVELRRRLRRRWKRHWAARDAEVATLRRQLEQQAGQLERDRERLQQSWLTFNTEAELGRRQLREEWQELALAQQRWEETLNHERADRDRQVRTCEQRALSLQEGERGLAEQQQLWQRQLLHLRRESQGLEVRVRNQREQLPSTPEAFPSAADSRGTAPSPGAMPLEMQQIAAHLDQFAGDLADQRLQLIEHWQQLLQVHDRWHQERETALRDVEQTAQQLEARESHLLQNERAVTEQQAALHLRQESLQRLSASLHGWHTRLQVQATQQEADHALRVAEAEAREQRAEGRAEQLAQLQQRRNRQRRQERAELFTLRREAGEARQHYLALLQEIHTRRATLEEEARSLTARHLALERFRQQVLGRAGDDQAEQRIERLERRQARQWEAAAGAAESAREELQAEFVRIEDQALELAKREALLQAEREECARQRDELAGQQQALQQEQLDRQQEQARLRARQESDHRQLLELRHELDRLGRHLMEDESPPVLGVRAA